MKARKAPNYTGERDLKLNWPRCAAAILNKPSTNIVADPLQFSIASFCLASAGVARQLNTEWRRDPPFAAGDRALQRQPVELCPYPPGWSKGAGTNLGFFDFMVLSEEAARRIEG
jgi:hypothetical protein